MKARIFTVHTKIVLLLSGVIFTLGAVMVVLIETYVSSHMTEDLLERGLIIGQILSRDCVGPILVNDLVKPQKAIAGAKQFEEEIIYIFILNNQGMPVVHTFGNYFPKGLAGANPIAPRQKYRVQLLRTEQGLINDVGLPLLGGNLGAIHIGLSEKHIRGVLYSITEKLIAAICLAVFLCIGITYYLARRALYPLREVSGAIKKIGEGCFNQKILVKTDDEIGLLAKAFNEMSEKLEKANFELKNTQSQLIQAAKMATVGQFSAGIAHEINNPLAGILNCVRSLLGDPEIKGERRGYLELALKGLMRIENTIGQILSFSGRQEFKPRLSDLNQLIIEASTFAKHRIVEQQIVFRQKLSDLLPHTMVDPYQLQQVFLNLINNALDALPKGGSFDIITNAEKADIEIKFIDNGEGIKQENIDKIFDPFFTTKPVGKGVGLGLSISYAIIRQHRGAIDIKSTENKGTTVTITLPRDYDKPVAAG